MERSGGGRHGLRARSAYTLATLLFGVGGLACSGQATGASQAHAEAESPARAASAAASASLSRANSVLGDKGDSATVAGAATSLPRAPEEGDPAAEIAATPSERDDSAKAGREASALDAIPPFVDTTMSQDELVRAMREATLRQFKPVGTSSVVFRVKTDRDFMVAFKPQSRQHRQGHRAEIAAYRLARALGMDNVPPACFRKIPRTTIETRLHEGFLESWPEIRDWTIWDDSSSTRGVAIYWIPALRDMQLDRDVKIAEWMRWLDLGSAIEPGRERMAADLSSMVLFDYLIANWDRFSGGNVHTNASGERVLLRDHNVAFGEPLPSHLHAKLFTRLKQTGRVSKTFVRRLVALDRAAIEEAVGPNASEATEPLLGREQIDAVLDRREAVLSHVGALVEAHGEAAVFAFP